MRVKDDGVGFAPAYGEAKGKETSRLGLFSMRERAVAVGGTLPIRPARRAGTEVEVRLPLPGEITRG